MKFLTKNSKDVFKVSIFFWEGWGGVYEGTVSNKTRSPQILKLAQHVSLSVQKAGLSSLLKGKACHYRPPGYSPEWTVALASHCCIAVGHSMLTVTALKVSCFICVSIALLPRLHSRGTEQIFYWLKDLTEHFVRTGPFNIFAKFTRNSEEVGI